jgi:GntR family transcriptional regulator, transcriptional repressor for pyruvate dehydrogenase complex
MKSGDRLPLEREPVEKLGVSWVSLREAFRAPESMGKIQIQRNAGSFVVSPNRSVVASRLQASHPVVRAFLDYLVDVRAAVEGKMVELVAKRADADLSVVRAALERTEAEMGEFVQWGSLDFRFETALAREADNPLLTEMQPSGRQLWSRLGASAASRPVTGTASTPSIWPFSLRWKGATARRHVASWPTTSTAPSKTRHQ